SCLFHLWRHCSRSNPLACVGFIVLLCASTGVRADIAVSVSSAGQPIAFSSVNISQGWRFTVNDTLQVTALGLMDANLDGFQENHPIAIFDSSGATICSTMLSAGTLNPL